MGEKLKKHDFTVLLQGTSGGKSKISHYFSQNPDEKSILVGLLDAWRDEAKVLKNADTLVIAKIPFDPPTDPQFLAKTVGMSNSFELYSKPIVLSRLNTLISNALAINPNIKIICSDERLETTEWGKFIKKNLA